MSHMNQTNPPTETKITPGTTEFGRLCVVLALTLPETENARHITRDAALRYPYITWEGAPVVIWESILTEAYRCGDKTLARLFRGCVERAPRLEEEEHFKPALHLMLTYFPR